MAHTSEARRSRTPQPLFGLAVPFGYNPDDTFPIAGSRPMD